MRPLDAVARRLSSAFRKGGARSLTARRHTTGGRFAPASRLILQRSRMVRQPAVNRPFRGFDSFRWSCGTVPLYKRRWAMAIQEQLGPAERIIQTLLSYSDHMVHNRPGIVRADNRLEVGVRWEPVTHKEERGQKTVYQ